MTIWTDSALTPLPADFASSLFNRLGAWICAMAAKSPETLPDDAREQLRSYRTRALLDAAHQRHAARRMS